MQTRNIISKLARITGAMLVAGLLLFSLPAAPVSATAIHLYVATTGSNSGNCQNEASPCLTVAYAISQAAGGESIHIAAGTYTENISVDKSLTFLGAGLDQTILDGNGSVTSQRVVNVTGAYSVSFSDVTIQNGTVAGGGGGIYINGGSLNLFRVKVTNNTGTEGGGIRCNASVTITNSVISKNTASTGHGGGIYTQGSLTMTDSVVSGNTNVDLNAEGGGIYTSGSSVSLSRVTLSGNISKSYGGGISINGSTNPSLTNVTISGNTANYGAGMSNTSSTTSVLNSTITGNILTSGGAGGVQSYSSMTFKNTIIANNAGNQCAKSGLGTWTSLGNNLDSGTTCPFTQTGDLQNTNPKLDALGNYSGPTQTHRLQFDSPAIDAGTDDGCPSTDQRGSYRPTRNQCDIGAYEMDNSAPTDISLSATSVYEGLPSGTVVGTLTTTDLDVHQAQTYSLGCTIPGVDDVSFSINTNSLKTAAVFDYDVKTSYDICIRTVDAIGAAFEKNFTIDVTETNDPPTDISLSNNSVNENQPIGTAVGTLSTTDPNVGDTHTYTFACSTPGADDASFQISGNSLQTDAVFDHETKDSYAICIRTDDGRGGTFDKDFTINVTDVIETITSTLRSVGAYDGWILESGENSNIGGTQNAVATTFSLGDDAADKQYRAILSFNTAPLPDDAVITKITIKIKKMGLAGTNPFTTHGGLKVFIRKPFFGAGAGLAVSDFQAIPSRSTPVGTFGIVPAGSWYTAILGSAGYPHINLIGTTQFRLSFNIGDNDDLNADYLKFYSGNYSVSTDRPTLIIEFHLP